MKSRLSQTFSLVAVLAALVAALSGCAPTANTPSGPSPGASTGKAASSPSLPPLPALTTLSPGVLFAEVSLPRPHGPRRLWIYLPATPRAQKLSCVLIAPAGSRLFHGMSLSGEDRLEHLPYIRAGYAVVAYELDGPLTDQPSNDEMVEGARIFREADAGVDNARQAIDYIRARAPQIDASRIYVAGHSSAATLALQIAEHVPGIRGCIAFAPACHLAQRLQNGLPILEHELPGSARFFTDISPDARAQDLRCPVFLFHAKDDLDISSYDESSFVQQLKQTNPHITYVEVPSGGHYDSMIRQGIPMAIRWLDTLDHRSH